MVDWGAASGAEVRFAVLGPVRAWREGKELDLPSRQVQLMLALLLVRAGGSVTTDELVDLLWDGRAPARALNMVHQRVGAIRRLIEPGLPPRASGRWLQRNGGSYRLTVDAASSDVLRFRRGVVAARQAAEAGKLVEALGHYLVALRAWNGRCAAGLNPPPNMASEFTALDRERTAALCAAADHALGCGSAAELVSLIRPVAEESPLDEALQSRLLLCLAASGQQAEAIAAFQQIRVRLSQDLGVEPGADLRAAYERVLRQQVTAVGRRFTATTADRTNEASFTPVKRVARTPPAQTPMTTRFFTGREQELGWLRGLLPRTDAGAVTVVTVDGLPGVGKTSLVVEWAHAVAGNFPDGQLFIDLQGYGVKETVDSGRALTSFLGALGVHHAEIPTTLIGQTSLYRTLMAGRRMLVILDNASDVEQVRPLLPAAPGCFVVVTSRNQLTGLVTHEGAHRLALGLPSIEESRANLRTRLATGGDTDDIVALDEIIERCGRLPLAIAIVSARATTYPEPRLRKIAEELREAGSLAAFDGDDPHSDVRSVFSWSYTKLSEPAARLFRLIAVHPGRDFGPATIASLAGDSPRSTALLIDELVRTRLVTRHRLRRYVVHDLIRRYADELHQLDLPEDHDAALARLIDHLRQTAYAAGRHLRPHGLHREPPAPLDGITPEPIDGVIKAMDWFATERHVLESVVTNRQFADFATWQLVESMVPFYQRCGMFRAWEAAAGAALHAARCHDDREGLARMHRVIAGAKDFQGRSTSAISHCTRALTLFGELGMPLEEAVAYGNLGWFCYRRGDVADALRHHETALKYFTAEGHRQREASALLGMGFALNSAGNAERAIRELSQASTIFAELGDHNAAGSCATVMAEAFEGLRRIDAAIEWRNRARQELDAARNDWESANNNRALGELYLRAGRLSEAVQVWQDAWQTYIDLGFDKHADSLTQRLADAGAEPRP